MLVQVTSISKTEPSDWIKSEMPNRYNSYLCIASIEFLSNGKNFGGRLVLFAKLKITWQTWL